MGTFDGFAMYLYVNAEIVGSNQIATRESGLVDMVLNIGADSKFNATNLDAFVDEVAIYDHVLLAPRVLAHYQAGTAK